ncbi:hypothetical protein Patl1_07063 [Pistacia atlantica]|uniref:Uncharacterized protein n=1 Tax=Pistacia atlantica TaxID=434234 RepID=A0ACC1AFY5_9ROSI|nr:hypothetical protein Patl1_07063 [Pistacia atlantica]
MGNGFRHWEIEGLMNNHERKNASILELKQLSRLTTLEIRVHNLEIIPQDFFFLEKLKRYRILIGDVWDWSWHATYGETSRMLKIKLNNSISLIHRVKILLKRTEELHLELNGVKNAIDELDEDGFAQLKRLHVRNGHELLYILNFAPSKTVFPKLESLFLHNLIKLEKICGGKLYAESFSKLRILKVEKCDMLVHLFSFSDNKKFSQLQEIEVIDCKNLKEIFGENERNSKFEFTQLHSLVLQCLPQFISFGVKNCSNLKTFFHNSFGADTLRKEPDEVSLEKHITDINPLFNEKVAFTSLEKMIFFHLDNLQLIWHNQFHKDSFSKLKEVRVEYCENLLTIFPSNSTQGFLTFHNLETLIVENCWNMKSLFPVSIATGLLQLNELWISFCGLEEIVAKEEVEGTPTFLFPQLTFLKLENLAELRHFYLGLHTIECPMLKRLVVHNCGKTKVNASNGESQPALFSFEKVGFSNLEHLELSEFPTLKERFWNAKVPASSFYSLKLLVLDTCLDTSTAIPFNVLCNLKNLEKLEIRNCDTLKEVFDMEGQLNVDRHTLKKSNLEVLDFNNLKSFKVHNCCSLRCIFTPSLILGLAQLEEIGVKNCALIEEIISKEEEKEADIEKIMVPQLNSIILESLPNLTSFYSGMNTLECPALKAITLAKCPQIETFVFTDTKHQSDHIMPLLSEKVVFPSLEEMFLSHLDNLQLIWHSQHYEDSFGKLKQVTIEFCEKIMTIVSANNSQGLLTLHNLEWLHIEKCWSMKSLFPVSIAAGLVKLTQLGIYSCELEEIVANEEVDGAPSIDLSGKVMPNLESLYLNVDAFRLQTKRPLEGFCKLKELQLGELNDESIPFFYGFLKSHKKTAQAALVFLANDVTSYGATVTGVTDSSALRDKQQSYRCCLHSQDDDIQMNKIQMGVGGNETAMIVLGFQQEGYPQRGLTILVLFQVRRFPHLPFFFFFNIFQDGFNKLHDLESSLGSFLQLLTTSSISLTVFKGSGMYFPESSFDIAEDDEGTTSTSWKVTAQLDTEQQFLTKTYQGPWTKTLEGVTDDDIQQMDKIQMEVGDKETAKIVWGSSRKAIPTEDGFKELHDLESSFASFPIKSLQELKGFFDIGEDDEGSSNPTLVSFKAKKVEGVRVGIQGKLALYLIIPFLSIKSF